MNTKNKLSPSTPQSYPRFSTGFQTGYEKKGGENMAYLKDETGLPHSPQSIRIRMLSYS
jgi:hypothetical protein